nr:unnamed protein product [Spirometra erinaceieuropaei]
MARVTDNETVSEAFAATDGVKQRYVLAHALSAMLMDRHERPGIGIVYRSDGQLPKTQRMQVPKRLSTNTVHGLLFAGDCTPNTMTEPDLQRNMKILAPGCVEFGLTIQTGKTVVMNKPLSNTKYGKV